MVEDNGLLPFTHRLVLHLASGWCFWVLPNGGASGWCLRVVTQGGAMQCGRVLRWICNSREVRGYRGKPGIYAYKATLIWCGLQSSLFIRSQFYFMWFTASSSLPCSAQSVRQCCEHAAVWTGPAECEPFESQSLATLPLKCISAIAANIYVLADTNTDNADRRILISLGLINWLHIGVETQRRSIAN